jgi:hypothetical protein
MQFAVRMELINPVMVNNENCLKMGKGVKRIEKKQRVVDKKHIIKLLEREERISFPVFNALFPRHEIKK